jgi:hypothetical protein
MRPDGNLPLRGYKASIWEGGYREPVRMLCFRRNYIALNVAAFVNTSLGRAHCILKHVGVVGLNGAAGDRLDAWQGEKTFFCAIYTLNALFYQDRLGTNIGKALKKGTFSLRSRRAARRLRSLRRIYLLRPIFIL